jgi:hypothetical protein
VKWSQEQVGNFVVKDEGMMKNDADIEADSCSILLSNDSERIRVLEDELREIKEFLKGNIVIH